MHSGPKICFLTKNIYKSVNICPEIRKKNSQKTCFSWKQPIHSGLGIILSIPLDRAWNFWSVETLGQPFGTKLEVSVSNPLTENRFSFSFYNELKKSQKNFFLTKLKIMMLFISPKRKNAILEMALKSFILSKLDHQMSKSWKRIAAHELETTSKFDLLKNWVPDCSAQGRISA